jgi:hypothetical protein
MTDFSTSMLMDSIKDMIFVNDLRKIVKSSYVMQISLIVISMLISVS